LEDASWHSSKRVSGYYLAVEIPQKKISNPPTLAYESHRGETASGNPQRISIPATLVYAVILTGILYLLIFHLSVDAPLRWNGHPPAARAEQHELLNKLNAVMDTVAGGKNVQYHVGDSSTDPIDHTPFFTTAYFSAVYQQYPARVFIGEDNQIINNDVDLKKADHLPSEAWMREHHVVAVFTLLPGDQFGPQVSIHAIH
jgi:hypothetical protein